MIPINNSDTAWLIVSDYNQDNGKFYEDLREDVNDPDVDQWHYVYRLGGMSVGSRMNHLGGIDIWDIFGIEFEEVGIRVNAIGDVGVGGIYDGQFIGGMPFVGGMPE